MDELRRPFTTVKCVTVSKLEFTDFKKNYLKIDVCESFSYTSPSVPNQSNARDFATGFKHFP